MFGVDYPTPDGTCVRDYIHVEDLARAHGLALKKLLAGGETAYYNLGSGTGYSVKEVYETAKEGTGVDIPLVIVESRPSLEKTIIGNVCKLIRFDYFIA